MLTHLSASLSHSSSLSTALHFRPLYNSLSPKSPPSLLLFSATKLLTNFHFYLSTHHKSHQRLSPFRGVVSDSSSGVSMESPSVDTDLSVESISDDLKKQSLGQDKVRLNLEDLRWDNSFVRELPGDSKTVNIPRQVDFVSLIDMFPWEIHMYACIMNVFDHFIGFLGCSLPPWVLT